MAQTKKRRRTKHRGTPMGTIETRGRTGKQRGSSNGKATKSSKTQARAKRAADRLNKPPTWRGAINRAMIAAVIFFGAVVVLFGEPAPQAAGLAGFMLVMYVPMSYFTDMTLYKRRQRKKQGGGG